MGPGGQGRRALRRARFNLAVSTSRFRQRAQLSRSGRSREAPHRHSPAARRFSHSSSRAALICFKSGGFSTRWRAAQSAARRRQGVHERRSGSSRSPPHRTHSPAAAYRSRVRGSPGFRFRFGLGFGFGFGGFGLGFGFGGFGFGFGGFGFGFGGFGFRFGAGFGGFDCWRRARASTTGAAVRSHRRNRHRMQNSVPVSVSVVLSRDRGN